MVLKATSKCPGTKDRSFTRRRLGGLWDRARCRLFAHTNDCQSRTTVAGRVCEPRRWNATFADVHSKNLGPWIVHSLINDNAGTRTCLIDKLSVASFAFCVHFVANKADDNDKCCCVNFPMQATTRWNDVLCAHVNGHQARREEHKAQGKE